MNIVFTLTTAQAPDQRGVTNKLGLVFTGTKGGAFHSPAFTMTTYQHVLPGMRDDAARAFGSILTGQAAEPRR